MIHLITPKNILNIASKVFPFAILIALTSLGYGVYTAFFDSPSDYQQGEFVRIMYIHVPAAWMALGIYSFMAVCSVSYIIWKNRNLDIIARSSAGVGAVFAFITLITGSIWGKPIWGTYWVWDARLTSMLILFLFYIGYILLVFSLEEQKESFAPAIVSILGFINVPIVKFSVDLWNTLHQPASILKLSKSSIHSSMMVPLFSIFIFYIFYFIIVLIMNLKSNFAEIKIVKAIKLATK